MSGDLNLTDALVYAALYSRTTLSEKNGWIDEDGRIYKILQANQKLLNSLILIQAQGADRHKSGFAKADSDRVD